MYAKRYAFLDKLPAPHEPCQSKAESTGVHSSLPGYPNLHTDDAAEISAFLELELQTSDLDRMSDYLWLMSKQSSDNISWLHHQRVKGREIVPSEEPKLHLVWFYDKIYIKPLPEYLLSRRFWEECLLNREKPLGPRHHILVAGALGLFRSYAYLIGSKLDLGIAKSKNLSLLPDDVSWEQWCLLRTKVLDIQDHEVSPRYRFGEIRLTRLNLYCKFLLFKPYYHRTYRQYGDYFASFYPPLLFMFGIASVMLGSMQLLTNVEQLEERWPNLLGLFRLMSVFMVAITLLLVGTLITIFAIKVSNEWVFAIQCRYSLKKKKEKSGSRP